MSHSPPGPFFFGSVDQWSSAGGDGGDDDEWERKPQKQYPPDYFKFSSDGEPAGKNETDSESEVSPHARAKFGSPEEHF